MSRVLSPAACAAAAAAAAEQLLLAAEGAAIGIGATTSAWLVAVGGALLTCGDSSSCGGGVKASDYTDKIGKIAKGASDVLKRPVSPDEIKEAIHRAKENLGRGGPVKNPDVMVDPKTGDVRPKAPNAPEGLGDSIGNIFDWL